MVGTASVNKGMDTVLVCQGDHLHHPLLQRVNMGDLPAMRFSSNLHSRLRFSTTEELHRLGQVARSPVVYTEDLLTTQQEAALRLV